MHRSAGALLIVVAGAGCNTKTQAATPSAMAAGPVVAPARRPAPCFVGRTGGAPTGAPLSLKLTPSRTSGVAPLVVFFDTAGTSSPATQRPFEDIAYCWDFGDPGGGNFAPSGADRNQAKGPVAAHVFEKPGTYQVVVNARDAGGRMATHAVDVTVDDPEAAFAGDATVCFSNRNDFTGCPAGARKESAASVANLAGEVAPNKRLLLHRGETFGDGSLELNVAGPGLIGAYGRGERPKLQLSGTLFTVSGKQPAFSDWRLTDLDIVGHGADSRVVSINGTAPNLLLLRVRARDIGGGVSAPDSLIEYWNEHGYPGADVADVLAIQDSEFRHLVGGGGHNFFYIAAHRLVMLGTLADDSTAGEHVLRLPWVDRGVISSNDLGNAPNPRHVVKLHAPLAVKGKHSERIVLSDNVFRSTGGHAWTVAIAPQDDQKDERVRHVLVERNLFLPGTAGFPLVISAQDVVVRDNVFDRGTDNLCIEVTQRGIEPAPARVAILNNTCYSAEAPKLLYTRGDTTDVTAFNNLIAGPLATEGAFDAAGLAAHGGNLVTAKPGFVVDRPGADGRNYQLTAASPAVDTADGTNVSPWDYSSRPRPVDGNGSGTAEGDVGAYEYAP